METEGFAANRQKEFIYNLVVSQGDITPYGSASFINYIRWYGIARDALLQWRNVGFDDSLKTVIETRVLYCNIQYKREAMLQDEIIIKVNASNIKSDSFDLLFTLIRRDNALLVSLGKQSISFRNIKTSKLVKLPEKLAKDTLKIIEVDEESMLFSY